MDTLEIQITTEIGGWGFGSQQLIDKLNKFSGSLIKIPMNSYGGEVFEGATIYNLLKGHNARVEVDILGYAMSMGTVIAMAADHVRMPKHGYFMIHDPWSIAIGDADDMTDQAELLEKIAKQLASAYMDKTGLPYAKVRKMMKEETWLTAKEAKKLGFIDEITDGASFTAQPDSAEAYAHFSKDILGQLKNLPDPIYNSFRAMKAQGQNNDDMNKFYAFLNKHLGLEIGADAKEEDVLAQAEKAVDALKASGNADPEVISGQVKATMKPILEAFNTKVGEAIEEAVNALRNDLTSEESDLAPASALTELKDTINALTEDVKNIKGGTGKPSGKGGTTPQSKGTGKGGSTPSGAKVVEASFFDDFLEGKTK